MAEGGFDEIEMGENGERWKEYDDDELIDYFSEIVEKRESLYKKHGDNKNTPEKVRVKYEKYDEKIDSIEKETDRRAKKVAKLFKETKGGDDYSWIDDDDLNYEEANLHVLRNYIWEKR